MAKRIFKTITFTGAKNGIGGLIGDTDVFETKPLKCEICGGFIERMIGARRFPDICSKSCEEKYSRKKIVHQFRVHRGPYPSKAYGCDVCGVAKENNN